MSVYSQFICALATYLVDKWYVPVRLMTSLMKSDEKRLIPKSVRHSNLDDILFPGINL
jgi:hypothetical protein